MSHPFGDLLSQYRSRKPRLSLARLANMAGYDKAILVRMGQGKKDLTGPSGRERVVRLIETLVIEGAVTTLDEANALLAAADLPPLFARQPAEAKLLSRLAPPSTQPGQPVRRTNLPAPLARFIGRAQEAGEVLKLLAPGGTRLLTLTGSGGAGKTRLAQHVASDLLSSFADGAWYAELAPLSDGTLLAETVAPAIGLVVADRAAAEQVIDYLRNRQALLVLDNCEHLIDAVATFTLGLLRACPRVSILATSREALNVEGESAWRVPPMQPDDAAQLFVERTHAARPDLGLDVKDGTVARICQRLDGMPLAIELAAARLHGMSLSELSARLDDRFALLTGGRRGALPRQQTLRATIDWSYDLLSEPERTLFRCLSVFVGGWTAELAEQVCTDSSPRASARELRESDLTNLFPLLLSLVSKSLVVMDAEQHDGETRYRYLETVREYAREKLRVAEHGELEAAQGRHAATFVALTEQSDKPIRGPQQRWWLARLERDYPNLHAALAWGFGPHGDALAGCRLFSNLGIYWDFAPHRAEAQRWAHLARAAVTEQMPPYVCGGVWLFGTYTDPPPTDDEVLAGYRTALAYYTIAGDRGLMAEAMAWVAWQMANRDPHNPDIRPLLEEGVALARAAGDTMAEHFALLVLGLQAQMLNEFDRAEALLQESLRLSRSTGDLANVVVVSISLALLYMERLQFCEALPHAQAAALVARQINDSMRMLHAECFAADIIRYLGDAPRAVILGEANLALARDKLPPTSTYHGVPVNALTKALNDVGEHDRALVLMVEWIRTMYQAEGLTNYRNWGSHNMDVLACVASGRGDALRAARLFGLADSAFAMSGRRRYLYNEWEYAPYIAKARAALGEAAYEAACAEGYAMTPEQAVAYALQGSQVEAA